MVDLEWVEWIINLFDQNSKSPATCGTFFVVRRARANSEGSQSPLFALALALRTTFVTIQILIIFAPYDTRTN